MSDTPQALLASVPAAQPAAAPLAEALSRGHQIVLLCSPPGHARTEALAALAACARAEGRTVVELSAGGDEPPTPAGGLGQRMLRALGLEEIAGDGVDIANILRVFLLNECAAGRAPLVLLNDAQAASTRELAGLLPVLRLRHRGALAVQLVLAGSPLLKTRLQAPELEPLAVRCGEVLDGVLLQPPRLLVHRGGRSVSEQVLALAGRWVIGRDATADIVLEDRWVSRYHALLLCDVDGLLLTDLASRNGTRVNGAVIRRRRLLDGDECRVGSFRLTLAWPARRRQQHRSPDSALDTGTLPQLAAPVAGDPS